MNGIETIARILKTEGIEWLACYPNNPLIEAAAKEDIRPIAFRHERGAVMAADGYSRTSDRQRFGVVAVQCQAGAENSVGGLAQANADNVPILVLPGGNNLDLLGVRPNFSVGHTYQSVTKRIETIYKPEQIVGAMRRAFNALRNGPGGPVVVEMSEDVCDCEVPTGGPAYQPPAAARQLPAAADIDAAAEALLKARQPLIWAGAGVLFASATEELKRLAELTQIPVFCTMPGKSAFDERHPLALGSGSRATTLAAHNWIRDCDLVLALGSSLTWSLYAQVIPPGKTIIHNTDNPDELNKDESVDVPLLGDARMTIQALIAAIEERNGSQEAQSRWAGATERLADHRAEWLSQWQPLLDSDEEPLNTYRVIGDIDRTLDRDNSIVTHDAGAPRDSIVPFYTATTPHSYIGWGKTTHLGFGIPLMIGAKLAHPDKFCLNLMGDGAFGLSGMDIEMSVRAAVPITTVVLNNGGMATYPDSWFPTARESFGVSNMLGDYAQIAAGMGAEGIVVRRVGEMVPALKEAQRLNAEGLTVLIDVHANMEGRRSRWDR